MNGTLETNASTWNQTRWFNNLAGLLEFDRCEFSTWKLNFQPAGSKVRKRVGMQNYFFKAAVQFSTTVIGGPRSSGGAFNKKR